MLTRIWHVRKRRYHLRILHHSLHGTILFGNRNTHFDIVLQFLTLKPLHVPIGT